MPVTDRVNPLQDLIARVEAAAGADRVIDRDVAMKLLNWCLHPFDSRRDDSCQSDTGFTCMACGADSWGNVGPSGQRLHASIPAVTASLDAALALVERVLPGWGWMRDREGRMTLTRPGGTLGAFGFAKTPALALLLALLRAVTAEAHEPAQLTRDA